MNSNTKLTELLTIIFNYSEIYEKEHFAFKPVSSGGAFGREIQTIRLKIFSQSQINRLVLLFLGQIAPQHHNNTKKFNEDDIERIQNLRRSINSEDMCFLIVDEVSTIDCRIIAMLSLRCQQIFDNELDFGGIPLMLTGDYNQLGPVKKHSFQET